MIGWQDKTILHRQRRSFFFSLKSINYCLNIKYKGFQQRFGGWDKCCRQFCCMINAKDILKFKRTRERILLMLQNKQHKHSQEDVLCFLSWLCLCCLFCSIRRILCPLIFPLIFWEKGGVGRRSIDVVFTPLTSICLSNIQIVFLRIWDDRGAIEKLYLKDVICCFLLEYVHNLKRA